MKLSLSWIFEHIDGNWHRYKINELIDKFNRTTAEIEHFYPLQIDLDKISLVRIETVNFKDIIAFSPEWNKKISVPLRKDIKTDSWFLVKKDGKEIFWATLADFGAASKEGFMPAISCPVSQQAGTWKKQIVTDDFILELDNLSITHRADLWAVRGIAREFAAILGLSLKPLEPMLKKMTTKNVQTTFKGTKDQFSIINGAPKTCLRFSGLYFSEIQHQASTLWMSSLLCRTDNRPIDLLVDATNYIMLDLGQPMHAFDADKIETKTIKPRMAQKGEKLVLLDDTTINLTADDLVITDGRKPVSLAGVMGGIHSGIDSKTKSLFLESASFDSSIIRKTSSRHRIRTEASVRFEKGLDPNQSITGIRRFLKLLDEEKIVYKTVGPLISVGNEFKPYVIKISHELLEKNLGLELSKKFVTETLKKLDFEIKPIKPDAYQITVPTFRGTKNMTIAVDIIEEVGRFWGWDNIPQILPSRQMIPNDIHEAMNIRKIKQHCAFGMHIHEVQNYPFFDESWLRELQWQPENAIKAKNPLSQNVTRLVTSLVPHLLKNVQSNITKADQLRFFELNRVWDVQKKTHVNEKRSLAGILWNYKGEQDFYQSKALLSSLFNLLHMPVVWEKAINVPAAWYNQYQTSSLKIDKEIIGFCGMIDAATAEKVGPGNAFIFELDADFLIKFQIADVSMKPLGRFPYVYHDISMLIPLEHQVKALEDHIKKVHKDIYHVELLDMFSKDEWGDRRSLTFRFYMRSSEKTLSGQEIDVINNEVSRAMKRLGAEIR